MEVWTYLLSAFFILVAHAHLRTIYVHPWCFLRLLWLLIWHSGCVQFKTAVQDETINLITKQANVHFKNEHSGINEFEVQCLKKKIKQSK